MTNSQQQHAVSPLETTLGTLTLRSPILNASGTFEPDTFARMMPLNEVLGAVVAKTITPNAQPGNAQQRTVELPGVGMLNSIGLQGKGLSVFLQQQVPALAQQHGLPLVMSLSASSDAEFAACLAQAVAHPNGRYLAAVELNLSCPNVKAGGSIFGSSPDWVAAVVQAARPVWPGPLWVKLTPNVTDTVPIAAAALECGADGLVAINTVMGAHIDIRRKRPSLSRVSGGYSGPGIKPIAIHQIIRLRQAFPGVPLVGVGGITQPEDVVEFLLAGANAVQIGTSCFANPFIFAQAQAFLTAYLAAEGLPSVASLVGLALP